jgi:nucleolar pre-ribosomal-associated protein 1
VKAALEEDDDHGQWCKRWREVEREVRRRVPDFQVVVAFSQGRSVSGPNQTKTALLAESAQRLLWMYHRCLPSLVAEARFDVGKLLQNFMEPMHEDGMSDGLQAVWKLHVLRLLKESNQFTWSKTGDDFYVNILLTDWC